jgi:dolichol kinase
LYDEVLARERDVGPVMFFAAFALVAAVWAGARTPASWVLYALLPMAWADPVGFYAGRAWGAHKLRNTKSLEGFTAVLAACLAVALLLGLAFPVRGGLLAAVLVAVGSAIGETLAPRHLDNVLMPIGALAGLAAAAAL